MIGDDEYYMDDEDDEVDSNILAPMEDDSDDDGSGKKSTVVDDNGNVISTTDESIYKDSNISPTEVSMLTIYDNVRSLGAKMGTPKHEPDQTLFDILTNVLTANPINTNKQTITNGVREALNKQGKSRILSTAYDPDGLMTGDDLDSDYIQSGVSATSEDLNQDARNQVSRFIDHLAKRDLSHDDLSTKKIKRRHIPAFIIFLFSAGMYDLIIDCPTMPEVYQKQIDKAFKSITRMKLDIVEKLARRYEENKRPQVAECVRRLGIAWFEREPAEIRTLKMYDYLGITTEDVMTYKEFKSKFNNVAKAITQESMSNLIAVYQEGGTFEILKDKTRQKALEEVKAMFKEWASSNPVDSELADKIIFRDI